MLILVGENVIRYMIFAVSKGLLTTYLFNYKWENNIGRFHFNQET